MYNYSSVPKISIFIRKNGQYHRKLEALEIRMHSTNRVLISKGLNVNPGDKSILISEGALSVMGLTNVDEMNTFFLFYGTLFDLNISLPPKNSLNVEVEWLEWANVTMVWNSKRLVQNSKRY